MSRRTRLTTQRATTRQKRLTKASDSAQPHSSENLPSVDLAQYVTTRQAAEMLGVTRSQVFHLITDKRIEGVKLGHDWLVLDSSVANYFKTKSRRGRPASLIPQLHETN